MSDYKGAAKRSDAFPRPKPWRQFSSQDRRQHSLAGKPQLAIPPDPVLHKKRHKIENMLGTLKD
jgi:hypothetical protein